MQESSTSSLRHHYLYHPKTLNLRHPLFHLKIKPRILMRSSVHQRRLVESHKVLCYDSFSLCWLLSLSSSMDNILFIPKHFRSMPLHASSSWQLFITYMLSTLCSPSLFHAYHPMLVVLTPCASLTIYTPLTVCTPCLFLIIYIHIPHAFHTSTMPSSSIYSTVEQSHAVSSLCFPITRLFHSKLYSESDLFETTTVNNYPNCLKS